MTRVFSLFLPNASRKDLSSPLVEKECPWLQVTQLVMLELGLTWHLFHNMWPFFQNLLQKTVSMCQCQSQLGRFIALETFPGAFSGAPSVLMNPDFKGQQSPAGLKSELQGLKASSVLLLKKRSEAQWSVKLVGEKDVSAEDMFTLSVGLWQQKEKEAKSKVSPSKGFWFLFIYSFHESGFIISSFHRWGHSIANFKPKYPSTNVSWWTN